MLCCLHLQAGCSRLGELNVMAMYILNLNLHSATWLPDLSKHRENKEVK